MSDLNPDHRIVRMGEDGKWREIAEAGERAASVHDTQAEVSELARKRLQRYGGGEPTIMGVDGKNRIKPVIAPANDPFPLEDSEQ